MRRVAPDMATALEWGTNIASNNRVAVIFVNDIGELVVWELGVGETDLHGSDFENHPRLILSPGNRGDIRNGYVPSQTNFKLRTEQPV